MSYLGQASNEMNQLFLSDLRRVLQRKKTTQLATRPRDKGRAKRVNYFHFSFLGHLNCLHSNDHLPAHLGLWMEWGGVFRLHEYNSYVTK